MAVAKEGFETRVKKISETIGDAEHDDGGFLLAKVRGEAPVEFETDAFRFHRPVEIEKVDLGEIDVKKIASDPLDAILRNTEPRL